MDLLQAKAPQHPQAKRKRVGRGPGSGNGKTCGRGHKGARSRSGWSQRNKTGGQIPLWRRLPKRGFSNAPFKKVHSVINVHQLDSFPEGAVVSPELLRERGIVKQPETSGVKVLGEGELTHSLTVRANAFSRSAREKIEAAGGTIQLIPEPSKPVRNKMKPRARQAD